MAKYIETETENGFNKDKEPKKKNFEDILDDIGGFGLFQGIILFCVLFYEIPSAFVAFVPVFTAAIPKHWECRDVFMDPNNENETIPVLMSHIDICECNGTRVALGHTDSIVAEWNLICDHSWVADATTSIQMFGMFFGNVIPPQMSDWYGRKKTFLGLIMLMAVSQGLSALSLNVVMFATSRFFGGVAIAGYFSLNGIYTMEFLTPKWRQLGGCLGPLGEGIALLALITYYIKPWRLLMLATMTPFVLLLFMFPFIVESPRWLLRQKRIEEAERVLRFIAKVNWKPWTDDNLSVLKVIAEEEGAMASIRYGYIDLFRRREVRAKTCIFIGIWFCWAFTYFGLSFNIRNFGVDPTLMLVLMGGADMIGFRAALLINNSLGRRKALIVFTTVSAVFFLPIAVCQTLFDVLQYQGTFITFILLGKLAVAGARSSIRCLTVESYPVAIRTMGFGVSRVSATLGGIASPQLAYLGSQYPAVPMFAFALLGVFGALLSLLLNETSGKPLQDGLRSEVKARIAPAEARYQLKSAAWQQRMQRSSSI